MGKFITVLVILLIIGGGVFAFMRLTGVEDTWIQDKSNGEWVRYGSPAGPAPRAAITDCYTRARSVYTDAVTRCVPRLCADDEVCINDLLDTLDSLRGTPAAASPTPAALSPEPGTSPAALMPSPAPAEEGGAGGGETDPLPSPFPTPEATATPAPSPAPATVTENESIRLSSPAPQAALTSPFEVRGNVKESITAVVVRIKGSNGAILIEETLTPRAAAEGGWRAWKITLAYDFDTTKSGFIEVVPAGGAAVSAPVTFQ